MPTSAGERPSRCRKVAMAANSSTSASTPFFFAFYLRVFFFKSRWPPTAPPPHPRPFFWFTVLFFAIRADVHTTNTPRHIANTPRYKTKAHQHPTKKHICTHSIKTKSTPAPPRCPCSTGSARGGGPAWCARTASTAPPRTYFNCLL